MISACVLERRSTCRLVVLLIALTFALLISVGCQPKGEPPKEAEMVLSVSSAAFREGEVIPAKGRIYRHHLPGANHRPGLSL